MKHFDILCSTLKQAQRNISDTRIRKMTQLNKPSFKKARQEFIMPLEKIIAMSEQQPIRLILDYVLISRKLELLNRPFNDIVNHSLHCSAPTLVVLFAIAEVNQEIFPLAFDFWEQEVILDEDENYFSKNELAEHMLSALLSSGLKVSEVLFDAGFCDPKLLEWMDALGIQYVCRFPCNRKVLTSQGKFKPKELFLENGSFYFDRHVHCYLQRALVEYAEHQAQLVVVANSRQKLMDKELYCILTNQTDLMYTQVFRHYRARGKIEAFFRRMKTYLGLAAFHRHHEDYSLIPHFRLRCAAYVLLNAFTHATNTTFHKALEQLQCISLSQVRRLLKPFWDDWGKSLVITTTHILEEVE